MSENIAADELRLLIERIERLEEEKKAIADDIRDVYAEAKARGYDTRTMRECVKLRKLETNERQEREALLDTYKAALGMDYAETPLGRATVARVEEAIERQAANIRSEFAAAESGQTETTISVNGGPAVPLDTVKKALDMVQGRKRRPTVSGIAADYSRDAASAVN